MTAAVNAPDNGLSEQYPEGERARIEAALAWADNLDPALKRGVTAILTELKLDALAVTAALVRQSLAADGARKGDAEARFGAETVFLAEEAARITGISATKKTLHEAENIRKMFFALVSDIRVIFIVLAEKLYVLRRDDAASSTEKDIKKTARECLSIYAPLADRLGVSWMKAELEDLALKHLNRDVFNQIKDMVALKKGQRQRYLDTVSGIIRNEARAAGITAEVTSRAKHFYSIYQKMRRRNKTAGEVLDLFGIRIISDSIENCYTLMGIVHRLWKPLDGRFKDYIAMPKPNGYRSLHTTVIAPPGGEDTEDIMTDAAGDHHGNSNSNTVQPGKVFPWSPFSPRYGEGLPMEIQIRTREMHQIAEYGVASHWLYKKGSSDEMPRTGGDAIDRLRDVRRTKNGGENSASFLENIKQELLNNAIFGFTPQGQGVELPAGATAIDFAYAVHSAVGDHCAAAKADGVIIPLGVKLKNTQVVEILTATNAHPHRNWLDTVKTARARSKIRAWLNENEPAPTQEKNAASKKKEAPRAADPVEKHKEEPPAAPVQRVYAPPESGEGMLRVRVEAGGGRTEKNLLFHFARCCRPVAGDVITGYVSRGRGIIIHRKDCRNLANIPDFAERRIETEWDKAVSRLVRHFRVEARFRTDLFSEIEGAVRKYRGHLLEGRLEEKRPGHLTGFFTMRLNEEDDLKKVIKGIRAIPAVHSITTLDM
ncbi:MAG: HD domain-containing protein [Spirochaetaceae bacterium]|jgi:GTP pyrophosphokinase|nr:HD domain-containing protein [Spirochaetaceae bacterium]